MRYFIILILFCSSPLNGQIAVDGFFSDWENVTTKIEEDDNHPGLDILSFSMSNDEENLYLRIETSQAFDIQDEESISIFIDADDNIFTGFGANGLGAEITYYFGNKTAYINYPTSTYIGSHVDLRLINSPTVTSNIFEIAIKRNLTTDQGTMTMDNNISISVGNGTGGDIIPNQSGGIAYEMLSLPSFEGSYSLDKTDNSYSRIMSWNVLNDGFLDPLRAPDLQAVIKSMNPDIIALQEVYNTPLDEIAEFLNTELPNSDGSTWQYGKSGQDVAVFTRDFLEAHESIDGNGIFLLYDDDNNPMIIYNVHLPCCANDESRQLEIDHILSVLRDKNPGFIYENETPIIITGDFNTVGLAQNVTSFLTGDIVNEDQYGMDFSPDWDGSNLEDANPYLTGFPSNYTWRSKTSGYTPGKLDWVFYSGSVMNQQNAFILDTEFLTESELVALNLNSDATEIVSDHLPLIVDFSFGAVDVDMDGFDTSVDCNDNDPDINPDAEEIANNDVDENCDGVILIIDADGDTFNSDEDCDDENAAINPDAEEIANNDVDENCDGVILIIDADGDTFNSDEDCDDENAAINPDAEEIPNNDVDENCDGVILIIDVDMDGYNSDEDCNDLDSLINPLAEEIPNNEIDENCDGEILIIDVDMDTFNSDEDCDDENAAINPGAEEIPNNDVDENCDGEILIIDVDMDGYNSDEDCNDLDSLINPLAEEIPNNGIDEDCDGLDLVTSTKPISQFDFTLYPNPAYDFVMIKLDDIQKTELSIFNISGQLVLKTSIESQLYKLDVSELSTGVFYMKVTNTLGAFEVKRFTVL